MEMIRFEHIDLLYGLALLPVFIILFWLAVRWKKRVLKKFGQYQVISRLMPNATSGRPLVKFILFLLAFGFLVIGLANPQVGSRLEEAERKGIDIMIALDVSKSMLAQDIKPSRLEKSKQAISRLLDRLRGDRIGMVVFAGQAYVQLPITTDYAAGEMFLASVSPDAVPTQGTAIGAAIETSMESFQENDHSKAIIVITDGENHEDDALEQARKAREEGITVYTIGMGLPEGAPIPVYQGDRQVGFKKDKNGNTVVTRLNESLLKQVADAGDGSYVRANNVQAGLNQIFDEINKLEKKEFETRVFSDYEDRFQYFIGAALLLLIIELLIPSRKSKLAKRFNLFENRS
ncbi:MAG: VWA domain-containing protein [Bacteroidales bacterium]|nr:VWA domain-containing protein [Bacteroidales bacterium]